MADREQMSAQTRLELAQAEWENAKVRVRRAKKGLDNATRLFNDEMDELLEALDKVIEAVEAQIDG